MITPQFYLYMNKKFCAAFLLSMLCASVYADFIIPDPILKDGFEEGTDQCFPFGESSIVRSSSESHEGYYSLRSYNREKAEDGVSYPIYAAEAGKSYKFDAYLFYDGNNNESQQDFKNLFHDYFKIGTSVLSSEIKNNNINDIIKKDFNCIISSELTPAIVMNQKNCQSVKNEIAVSLNEIAVLLKFCDNNKFSFIGNGIIDFENTPSWFFKENFDDGQNLVSKEIMLKRLESYIKNLLNALDIQYPNLGITGWNVVSNRDSFQNSLWKNFYEYETLLEKTFVYARQYSKNDWKLYYACDVNDCGDDVTVAENLQEKGLCDGILLQSHMTTKSNIEKCDTLLSKLSDKEFDIVISDLDVLNENDDIQEVTDFYISLFSLYEKYKENISAVVFSCIGGNDQKVVLYNSLNPYSTNSVYSTLISEFANNAPIVSKTFQFDLQYDENGKTKHESFLSVDVPQNVWFNASGVMKIPENASQVSFQIHTTETGNPSDLIDFFVDDVLCIEKINFCFPDNEIALIGKLVEFDSTDYVKSKNAIWLNLQSMDYMANQISIVDSLDVLYIELPPYNFHVDTFSFYRIPSSNIVTFVSPVKIPVSDLNGDAYVLSDFDGSTLCFKQIEDDTLADHIPYVVKVKDMKNRLVDDLYNVNWICSYDVDNNAVQTAGNMTHKGNLGMTQSFTASDEYSYYAYKEGSLYMMNQVDLKPFRTLFELKNETGKAAPRSRLFSISFNDNTTGVVLVENGEVLNELVTVYDEIGRVVRANVESTSCFENLSAGVYVVNGKKFIVKK